MARSWRAEQVANTGVALKAPTYREHQVQQSPNWTPKKAVAEEVLIAESIMAGLDAEDVRIPLGKQYTLWRYPHGLAIQTPSGWTVYMELAGQVRRSSRRVQEGRSFSGDS